MPHKNATGPMKSQQISLLNGNSKISVSETVNRIFWLLKNDK